MRFHAAFWGQVLIVVGGELLAISLPSRLYALYLGLICDLETGTIDAVAGDLSRQGAHTALIDWFAEEYPHIDIEDFVAALETRVAADIRDVGARRQ